MRAQMEEGFFWGIGFCVAWIITQGIVHIVVSLLNSGSLPK